MKNKLLQLATAVTLVSFSNVTFGQAPNLGTAANFVLFSSDGAVTNNTSSFSHLTGDVGTGNPATTSTGFGNVNGTHHDGDAVGVKCAADLLVAYNQLKSTTPTIFPSSSVLGNGATLIKGVYSINSAATLVLDLFLDAKGDSNAVFIFQIEGPFSTSASSKIKLINGAKACNVFWKIEGLVDMATGTTMRGTIVANNAAIIMSTGDTLEGRALTTTGAITINGVFAYTPIGCGSPILTGPTAPTLGAAACFALFSSTGAVSNSGITKVTGDVGSNSMSPTGFVATDVIGKIHANPDAATLQCKNDLALAYTYLNTLAVDITLRFPAQFGNNLVLTPHTYLLDAATVLTDTVSLNAQGNPNAVFVIKINGALSTTVYSKVKLINGAQAKNVYWKIEGAVDLNNYTVFNGTIVVNNGALGALNTGVKLDGRGLTTNGALTTTAIKVIAPVLTSNCLTVGVQSFSTNETEEISIYPNPFTSAVTIVVNDISQINLLGLRVYNVLGAEVMNTTISQKSTTLETSSLPSGIYFYKIIGNGIIMQSGKLVAQE